MTRRFGPALAASLLAACSTPFDDDFSCPGYDGLGCTPVSEVHDATLDQDWRALRDQNSDQDRSHDDIDDPDAQAIIDAQRAKAVPVLPTVPSARGDDGENALEIDGSDKGGPPRLDVAMETLIPEVVTTRTVVQAGLAESVFGAAIPLITTPNILRVLVLPWVDDDGDLHAGGHVYLRIDNGDWTVVRP